MPLPKEDQLSIIRMASLIGRHRDALSPFEAELVENAVDRFRTKGASMSLTVNERLVLADALMAMDKAKAEAEAGAAPHPLAFLQGQMTRQGWDTWIAPLKVERDDQGRATIFAPGSLALCKVRQDWGLAIARELGECSWQVEGGS